MPTFSERIGVTPIKSIIQIDSISRDLENSLWNALIIYYWDKMDESILRSRNEIRTLYYNVWAHYFKNKLDEIYHSKPNFISMIKKYFFTCEWYEKYNLIEFVKNSYHPLDTRDSTNKEYIDYCNIVFERELSGYRFIDGTLGPIITPIEIESIEDALTIDDIYKPVKTHFGRALQFLSDKTNPDYRNSIKESISGVESFCSILTKNPKATLGQALKVIEEEHSLHTALKSSFNSLYGYASDGDGIRHHLKFEENSKQEDAIYMLVSCSAFINYLIKKASTTAIK